MSNASSVAVGCRVKVHFADASSVEGDVFSVDPESGMLVLYGSSDKSGKQSHTGVSVEMVNLEHVQKLEVLAKDGNSASVVRALAENIPKVDLKAVERRSALEKKKMKDRYAGQFVSQLGQQLFEVLSKTMPCRWDISAIVIFDSIRVEGPNYDYAFSSDNDPALPRVRQILSGERKKLGLE